MELITADELSELLRISRNQVVLMAKRGDIPCYRVGGRFRFDAVEIEDWLKHQRKFQRTSHHVKELP